MAGGLRRTPNLFLCVNCSNHSCRSKPGHPRSWGADLPTQPLLQAPRQPFAAPAPMRRGWHCLSSQTRWRGCCHHTFSRDGGPRMGWGAPPSLACPSSFPLSTSPALRQSSGLLRAPMSGWLSLGTRLHLALLLAGGMSSCVGAPDGSASGPTVLLGCWHVELGWGEDGLFRGTGCCLQELPGATVALMSSCCPCWPASTRKSSRGQGSWLAHPF